MDETNSVCTLCQRQTRCLIWKCRQLNSCVGIFLLLVTV